MNLAPQDRRLADQRLDRARGRLFRLLVMLMLLVPLATEMEDVSSDASLGPPSYGKLATSFALDGLLPGLAVSAALVALFPRWRLQRVALPAAAALMSIAWVTWSVFDPSRTSPDHPWSDMRPLLFVARPLGFVVATAFIFLVARARRSASPLS